MYLDNPAVPLTSRIVLEDPQKLGADSLEMVSAQGFEPWTY